MRGIFIALMLMCFGFTADAQSYYRNNALNVNLYPQLAQNGLFSDNRIDGLGEMVSTTNRWGVGADILYFYNFSQWVSLGSGLTSSVSFFTHEYELLGEPVITDQKDDLDALRLSVPLLFKYTFWFNEYNKLGLDIGPSLNVYYAQTKEEFLKESDTHQLIYRPGFQSTLEGSGTESGFSGIQLEGDIGLHFNTSMGQSESELQFGVAYHVGGENVYENGYVLSEFNVPGPISEGTHVLSTSFAALKVGFLF